MAGAWEIRDRANILCAILHVDVTTVAWAFGLRMLQPQNMAVIGISGMPFDHARNQACMRALEVGATHLFFLDSDVVPPPDAVLRLLSHKKPIVSGVYHRRSPPEGIPVMIKNGTWVTQYPANSLIEVDVVGAGCLLIRRDVLEKLPPVAPGHHWFSWQVDLQGHVPPGRNLSEDFVFCCAARDTLGIPTLVDTSVQCKHIGYAQAEHGSFRPLNT